MIDKTPHLITRKIQNFYVACSPELGMVSYGNCQDEAINNLTAEVRALEQGAGEESHAP